MYYYAKLFRKILCTRTNPSWAPVFDKWIKVRQPHILYLVPLLYIYKFCTNQVHPL